MNKTHKTIDKGKLVKRIQYYINGERKYLQGETKAIRDQKLEVKRKLPGFSFSKNSSKYLNIKTAYEKFAYSLTEKQKGGGISRGTLKEYESYYDNHIKIYFNDKNLVLLDKKDVIGFVNYLKEKTHIYEEGKIHQKKSIDFKTLKKIFNFFQRIISYNSRKLYLDRNVAKEMDYLEDVYIPKQKQKMVDLNKWTFEVMQEVVYKIDNPMIRLICMILLETAARPSEIRALDRSVLLFLISNKLQIHIKSAVKYKKKLGDTKTEKGDRIVDISASLKDKIVDYLNTLDPLQDKLFLNSKGKYVCVERIGRAVGKAFSKMQPGYQENPIPRKAYMFRHYRTTYFAAKGKFSDGTQLANYIGDKSIDFVNSTYIKPYRDQSDQKDFKENITWN
tara:strand:+ start:84 stop:1256 length:1173 start_codon:yes stop_codon:yes gene_type:complete